MKATPPPRPAALRAVGGRTNTLACFNPPTPPSLPGCVERNCGKAGKNHRPQLARQETQLLLVSSYKKKKKNGKLTFVDFISTPPTPHPHPAPFKHRDRPIMVSLYMPLSDVKQNSKSVSKWTSHCRHHRHYPHHPVTTSLQRLPTHPPGATTFPSSAKFTLCKQRSHFGPSPGETRVVTVT